MKFYLLIGSILLFVSSSLAEISYCDGLWTNRSCEGASSQSFREKEHIPPAQEILDLDKKKLLIHDLEVKRYRYKRTLGLETDLRGVRIFCLQTDSSVQECYNRLAQLSDQMRGEALILAKLEEKQQAEEKETVPQKVNVVIYQDYGSRYGYRHLKRRWRSRRHVVSPKRVAPPAAPKLKTVQPRVKGSAGFFRGV